MDLIYTDKHVQGIKMKVPVQSICNSVAVVCMFIHKSTSHMHTHNHNHNHNNHTHMHIHTREREEEREVQVQYLQPFAS